MVANNLIGDPATAGGLTEGALGNLIGDGAGVLLPLDQIIDVNLAGNGGSLTLTMHWRPAVERWTRATVPYQTPLETTGFQERAMPTSDTSK